MATVLNELALEAEVGVLLEEGDIPVRNVVNGACEILGIDPLYVANEGKLVAIVPADETDAALAAMQAHPLASTPPSSGRSRPTRPGSSSSAPASAAPASSTCWSGTPCHESAEPTPPGTGDENGARNRCVSPVR